MPKRFSVFLPAVIAGMSLVAGLLFGAGRAQAGGYASTATPVKPPALSSDSATYVRVRAASSVTASVPTLTPRPPLPTAGYLDDNWKRRPVIPEVDPAMRAVYEYGLSLGNDPHAFSKVGDCNSESEFYLTPFDRPGAYRLGPYAGLQALIDNFAGSFGRLSMAAQTGFGPGSLFDPTWADPSLCSLDEGPLACEYRLHRPSLVLIGLGTHNQPQSQFENRMRTVIEFWLERGVVPILSTKVDTEGGDWVNADIAFLAGQYGVPLWNFWRAEQPLYNHGQPEGDGVHFTWARNYFDSPYSLGHGWPVRNLTALQALEAVWRAVR